MVTKTAQAEVPCATGLRILGEAPVNEILAVAGGYGFGDIFS